MDWKAFKASMRHKAPKPPPSLPAGGWLQRVADLVSPCIVHVDRAKGDSGTSFLQLRVWYADRDLTFDMAALLEAADRDEAELANILGGARGVLMWGQEPPCSPWFHPYMGQQGVTTTFPTTGIAQTLVGGLASSAGLIKVP
jgi:hypothetical protein